MDEEVKRALEEERKLLNSVFISVEKTRKYFLWTVISSLILFVLPLIIFLFLLPMIVSTLTGGIVGGF